MICLAWLANELSRGNAVTFIVSDCRLYRLRCSDCWYRERHAEAAVTDVWWWCWWAGAKTSSFTRQVLLTKYYLMIYPGTLSSDLNISPALLAVDTGKAM